MSPELFIQLAKRFKSLIIGMIPTRRFYHSHLLRGRSLTVLWLSGEYVHQDPPREKGNSPRFSPFFSWQSSNLRSRDRLKKLQTSYLEVPFHESDDVKKRAAQQEICFGDVWREIINFLFSKHIFFFKSISKEAKEGCPKTAIACICYNSEKKNFFFLFIESMAKLCGGQNVRVFNCKIKLLRDILCANL